MKQLAAKKDTKTKLKMYNQSTITPLGIDDKEKWCNIFVLVPKSNGKVRLCSDLARLNQALIRPVHRESTLGDIFPKLNNKKLLSYRCEFFGAQP